MSVYARKPTDDTSTSSNLLRRVVDWKDHPAWIRFRDTYDPHLRLWCRGFGLGEEDIDEICQRIWCELADRMRTFEYDPSGSFRGWLRRLCASRTLNYLREKRKRSHLPLDDRVSELAAYCHGSSIDQSIHEEAAELAGEALVVPHHPFLEMGQQIQSAVRARVKPHNWEAFWLVAICDWSVEQTALELGMSKVAVYAAVSRVAEKLSAEGQRRLDEGAAGGEA